MEKTWKNESRHQTFESADQRRNTLVKQNISGMLVKVRLMNSDNTFVVKTWTPPPEKQSKNNSENNSETKGRPKTRAQRRALRDKRKRAKETSS